jgi:two-component system sensor histidine kinase DesK
MKRGTAPTLTSGALFTNFRPVFSYFYIAYLGFLLLDPILQHHGARLWPGTIAVIAAFLVLFTIYVRTQHERWHRIVIAGTFVLGLITIPWNTGGCTFFVYVAAFIPFSFASLRTTLALFAIEIASIAAEVYFLHLNWFVGFLSIFLLAIIGGSNIFFAEQKRTNAVILRQQEEVEAMAAVAERERIARDLHDVLGHTLSVIVLKSELAGRLLLSDEAAMHTRAAAEIADVERTARTALAEVREAIGGYRSKGLLAEIEAARRTLDAAGVTLTCDLLPEASGKLTPQQETTLALSLREAVTNIVRHAHATVCTLHFGLLNGRHSLLISDNGAATASLIEGNGLRGMRERVEALGGEFSLAHDGGTRLAIQLPLTAALPVLKRTCT